MWISFPQREGIKYVIFVYCFIICVITAVEEKKFNL